MQSPRRRSFGTARPVPDAPAEAATRASRPHRLVVAAWLCLAATCAAALLLPLLGDVWWAATLLEFGPRWVTLVALAPVALAALAWAPRALVPLALAAVVTVGPIMGFRPGLRAPDGLDRTPGDVRLVTANVEGLTGPALNAADWARGLGADVLVMQECYLDPDELSAHLPGWHVHVADSLCFATRAKEVALRHRDPREIWAQGVGGALGRYDVTLDSGPLRVVAVHLATPRSGLAAMVRLRFWQGIPELVANTAIRRHESDVALGWTRGGAAPVVVAGDFNLTAESAIFREVWGGFEDAFTVVGLGFGFTKHSRLLRARIDHVLYGPGLRARRAWVGPEIGSDHHPLAADLERI